MKNLEQLVNKDGLTILGSMIKLNRISQNMSQQALSEGICVSSYLSKIENGEVVPSLDVIDLLFQELAIDYRQDYQWVEQIKHQFQLFFEELNFNGFTTSGAIFNELQQQELTLIHSPLIVDYYLVKLAYYCGIDQRELYEESFRLLSSIKELLTVEQRYRYCFYRGVDHLFYHHRYDEAKQLFLEAKAERDTGQVREMLAIVNYKMTFFYDSVQESEKAMSLFIDEMNLVSFAGLHEFQALLAYKMGSMEQALELSQRAITYARKINRQDLTLTPMLTKVFVLWQAKHLHEMEEQLIELDHLRQTLMFDWPILGVVDLLKALGRQLLGKKQWQTLIQVAPLQLKPAMLLAKHCVLLESGNHLSLIKSYQKGAFRQLLLDEIIYVLLKEYYQKTRQYKEVAMLLESGSI